MTAAAEGNINDTVFVREFCHRVLPDLLTGAGLSDGDAHSVTVDVIRRARMLTALPADYFDVLVTPFIEEVTQHRPLSAPAWLRAAVVVAVRNSRLEDFHALGGPLRAADITAITKAATEPLAQLLKEPGTPLSNNTLAGLDTRYPRAWASLAALSDLMASHDDTEHAYSTPQAPVPGLPGSHERIHAEQATGVGSMVAGQSVIASGVDPRFDQALLAMMQQVRDGNAEVVPLSALSRLSRNSDKQLRVLEFLLAHGATVLTTNYLLNPGMVAVRTRPLVKPDSYDLRRSMKQLRGLGPTHACWIKALRNQW
ncbi:recombinase family protein [Streptomyces longwoodensis]|uniref:recombinase family protein n=1 Tax=Streptomyces longwoodensis TaxID=68231 RepID=UPI002DDBB518|nr:recombinase family protein [Streptomyces longwoodensis]WRY92722.1 recombinase family protein [Streptomyces longwoodensis]